MNKQKIVLDALLLGLEINFKHFTCKLFKPNELVTLPNGEEMETPEYWLAHKMESNGKPCYLGLEYDFADLLNGIDKDITDEYAVQLGADLALNDVKRQLNKYSKEYIGEVKT